MKKMDNYIVYNDPELKFKYKIFNDSTIINLDTGREIKHCQDKRRINQSPMIYFKCKSGGRKFFYLDQLMGRFFIKGFEDGMKLIHLDGDVNNCSLDNLMLPTVHLYLNDKFDKKLKWKKVSIDNVALKHDYYISENGILYDATTNSFRTKQIGNRDRDYGLARYNLITIGGKTIHCSASRLVATHFIKYKPEGKKFIYFKDGNKDNLHYTNLCWGDRHDLISNSASHRPDRVNLKSDIMGEEIWLPIKLDEELYYEYEVSNYGRFYCKYYNKIISLSRGASNINNQSWLFVNLRLKNGKTKKFLAHRIVAQHFIPNDNPKEKVQVNHINGNPECNLSINLEWVSTFDNMRHALNTNLLHSSTFTEYVTSKNWRTKTIVSWVYSLADNNDKRYKIFSDYVDMYDEKNIQKLSFNEFKEYIIYHMKHDKDFRKIFTFYNN